MKDKLIKMENLREGDEVKWNHLEWHKVLEIEQKGKWTYLKLEGLPQSLSIWHDIEMPWRGH